jgi:hypothetical protein
MIYDNLDPAALPQGTQKAPERASTSTTWPRARASDLAGAGACRGVYLQRVDRPKPPSRIMKPTRMFHRPIGGIGSCAPPDVR